MNIIDQLKRDEGIRASAYQDSLGFWTIGIGTCIDGRKGCGLSEAEVELLCQNRVDLAKEKIAETWPWTGGLDDARMGALLNMVYQMGIGGVSKFKNALIALQAGDYEGASEAMLDSVWAKMQSPTRAARLAKQIQTGEWQ